MVAAFNFLEEAFGGCDLVGSHEEEVFIGIKDGVVDDEIEEGVLLEEGWGEVGEVFEDGVIGFSPMHGEVEAVLIALGGVSEVAGIGAVGDDEDLEVFEEGGGGIEAFFGVSVDLVEGIADGCAAFFEFNLDEWEAVDEDGYVVAVFVFTGLFELGEDLEFIAGDVGFIDNGDVLDVVIVKAEVVDVVAVDFFGLVGEGGGGVVEPFGGEAVPFVIGKGDVVEGLDLSAEV